MKARASVLVFLCIFLLAFSPVPSYLDIAGGGRSSNGRERNSLAAIVTGIVAHEINATSIDVTAVKTMWPDTKVKGKVSAHEIDCELELTFATSRFTAAKVKDGLFRGTVERSGWDWGVEQQNADTWLIDRAGLRFSYTLQLSVANGKISGTLSRPMGFDWRIHGTYEDDGSIDVEIEIPMGYDVALRGRIDRK